MNFNRVLIWFLKIFLLLTSVSLIFLYTRQTMDEYQHLSDPLEKRIFLMNKTIVYTLMMICLTSGLFSGWFFLQSSSTGLAFIWYEKHKQYPAVLWTGTEEQIAYYVLLITVVIVSQLLGFALKSKSRTEFIPYFSPSKASNEFSYRRPKIRRSGSGSSYTRNANGKNSILIDKM